MPPAMFVAMGMSTFWAGVASQIVIMAALYVITPKPKSFTAASIKDRWAVEKNSVAPRRIVYGTARVGGTLVFQGRTTESGDPAGYNGKMLHLVITIATHACDSILQLWFNDKAVNVTGNEVQTAPYTNHAHVEYALGASDQSALANLVSDVTQWTSNHRGRGVTYAWLRLKWNSSVYPNGIPGISFTVQGKSDIYDPRDDSTGYSANAALCIADYLTSSFGMGASYDDIIGLEAAANICDEAVPLKAGGTEPRYEMHGSFDLDEKPAEILARMQSAIAGYIFPVGSKWVILPGVYRTPTLSLGIDDLRGPVRVQTRTSRRESYNTVRGVFVAANRDGAATDYPAVTNATYVTEDGGEVVHEYDLPFTTSGACAQRIAKIELERGRRQVTVDALFSMRAYQLLPGDVVEFTFDRYGWTDKTFEVVSVELHNDDEGRLAVRLSLRETDSSVYSWTAASDEQDLIADNPPSDAGDFLTIAPPTNLVLTPAVYSPIGDGINIGRLRIAWTASLTAEVIGYEVEIKPTGGVYEDAGYVAADSDLELVVRGLEGGVLHYVRVRAIGPDSLASVWLEGSATSNAARSNYSDLLTTNEIERTGDPGIISRGMQTGFGAKDGDTVTFGTAFDAPPAVTLIPKCITYGDDATNLPSDQRLVLEAESLTGSGFTLKAKIAALVGATTLQTLTSFTGTDTVVPDTQHDKTKTASAEAYDDKYTFEFDVSIPPAVVILSNEWPSGITVRAWTKASGGSWVERGAWSYSNSDTGSTLTITDIRKQITVDGLGANAEFRLTGEMYGDPRGDEGTISNISLDYYTATAPYEASATPNADTVVDWIAVEGT